MTEKLYLQNPYLREIDGRIIEKKYMNNRYYLKLNRTIFYPNLVGGQPGDIGTINGVEVLEAYEEGNDIIHVVKDNIHSDKVQLSIDWENRLDYMQQHSGQHLLSAAFYKLYNGETVGFYIGKEYVYIDVTIPELTEEEVDKIETFANRIIFSNFQIKSYIIEKKDVEKIPVRKQPTVNSNIRIVEIDGIDFSPCGGTHHRSTGEIGLIKIRKWEKYKGNTRVEFVCGNRALKDYTWKNKYIKDIGLLLSSKDTDVYQKVNKLYLQKEDLEKENRDLRERLYKYKSEEFFKESININKINYIFKELKDVDYKEISFISSYLNNKENLIQIYGLNNDGKGQFLISRSNNLDINLKNILKDISSEISIKGGGSLQTVQGGCSIDELSMVINKFYEKIKASQS
ncbi:hypothetical protein KQI42_10005 [Tissierella sp. MSJ-40]|uniref:Alanyl-transfer RNA synthetases family profile domain-containing protein n=1 Tax=Tissierella simiarum TaxID=2841534 RepID=A0ABS6E5Z0_9FIRM|nr:DHHA1 domain-containing protein [Tissierella simiarum]MBU5438344.1 hypothetical protein [Tissierella simiarum]